MVLMAARQRLKSFATSVCPALSWLACYKPDYLLPDLVAGITVSTVAIPQGIAYAALANLPPVFGLYTLIAPSIIYAIFGSAPLLHIGPFTLTSLMIGASSTKYLLDNKLPSDEQHISAYVMSLSLVVGIVQLTLAILKVGIFIKKFLLRKPFVSAFTTASAFIIATSQLGPYFALKVPQFRIFSFFQSWVFIVTHYAEIHLPTLCVAFTSSIMIIALTYGEENLKTLLIHRLNQPNRNIIDSSFKHKMATFFSRATYPVILVTIIIYIILSETLQFGTVYGIKSVGKIPTGLPGFNSPELDKETFFYMLPDSLPVALVSYIITISLAESFASSPNQVRANQELFAVSLTCIIGSFFSSYSGAGSLSRTAVVHNSGAKTQISSVVSALVVVVILLWIAPVLQELPVSVLASIIIVSLGSHMRKIFTDPWNLWKDNKRLDSILWIITFVAVVAFDAAIGCLIGLGASFLVGMSEKSHPHFEKDETSSLLRPNTSQPFYVTHLKYSAFFPQHRSIFSFSSLVNKILANGFSSIGLKSDPGLISSTAFSNYVVIDLSAIKALTAYDRMLLKNIANDFHSTQPHVRVLFIHPTFELPSHRPASSASSVTEMLQYTPLGQSNSSGDKPSSCNLESTVLIFESFDKTIEYIQLLEGEQGV